MGQNSVYTEVVLLTRLLLSYYEGRILNRFSKDMGFVDDMMPFTYCDFLQVKYFLTKSMQ